MKLTEDNCILSDSGHTIITNYGGKIDACQHSIVACWLTEEDQRMFSKPEEVWEEFFRQSTPDVV